MNFEISFLMISYHFICLVEFLLYLIQLVSIKLYQTSCIIELMIQINEVKYRRCTVDHAQLYD